MGNKSTIYTANSDIHLGKKGMLSKDEVALIELTEQNNM